MRVYLMSVMDEKHSYIFKYEHGIKELFKRFSESGKLVRVGDFIINKERLKEIKDITHCEYSEIEHTPRIEFSKNCNDVSIGDIIIRDNCIIDMITREICDKINLKKQDWR